MYSERISEKVILIASLNLFPVSILLPLFSDVETIWDIKHWVQFQTIRDVVAQFHRFL